MIRVAASAVAIREIEGHHATMPADKRKRIDDKGSLTSLDLSIKKIIGGGAVEKILETVLDYLGPSGADEVKVLDMLKNKGLDKIPLGIQPPRAVLLAYCAVKGKARMDHRSRRFVYLALVGCLPSWLHRDKVGGKSGLPLVGTKWFGTDEEGISLLRTSDNLGPLQQKPLFFQESIHFWGAATVMEAVVMAIDTLSVRHRWGYLGTLTLFQGQLRLE